MARLICRTFQYQRCPGPNKPKRPGRPGWFSRFPFRASGRRRAEAVRDDGEVSFKAQDLVVRVSGGKILLDHVTFPIPEKCLLAVMGPSGAGKSTVESYGEHLAA